MPSKAPGEKLKATRKKLSLSQDDFAKSLNTNQSTISKMERGTMEVPLTMIEELVESFNIDPRWFFKGTAIFMTSNADAQQTEDPETEYKKRKIEQLEKEVSQLKKRKAQLDAVILKQSKKILKLEEENVKLKSKK